MSSVLSCRAISCRRTNWNETGRFASIENVSASFDSGVLCGFDGPDDPGRLLLLSILGLLEPADSGVIYLDGQSVSDVAKGDLRDLRAKTFGFLFAHPCLLPSFSLAENVAMPLFRICSTGVEAARLRTLEVLDFCEIAHRENQLAGSATVSTQCRAAFARALVHRPKILIALSPRGGDELFALAERTAKELGVCVLWAAENGEPATRAHRLIQIQDGRIALDQLR